MTANVIAWDYSVVAFIDVLGFSSFVEEDSRSEVPLHLARLYNSLQEVKKAAPSQNLELRAFSDSIVISTKMSGDCVAELFSTVVQLQRIFIKNGVLIRGAIAFGKHFADAELIYSEALIRAYTEERDQARFPRVLVNHDLLDWFCNDPKTDPGIKEIVNESLIKDRDNRAFIHYLDASIIVDHLAILTKYNNIKLTASVLEKIQWLAEYHNFVARQVDDKAIFSGPAVEGFRMMSINAM